MLQWHAEGQGNLEQHFLAGWADFEARFREILGSQSESFWGWRRGCGKASLFEALIFVTKVSYLHTTDPR